MSYEHTQRARWLPLVVLPAVAVVLFTAVLAEPLPGVVRAMMLIGVVLFSWLVLTFSRLTVVVRSGAVRLRFGAGWPRRSIDLARVTQHRTVRNSWWYGFGIRWIPRGSLWNVSGLDAVELDLEGGRRFRIGTDEPEALAAALNAATGRNLRP